jgi:hypothetical protein
VVSNSIRASLEQVDVNLAHEVASVLMGAASNHRDPKVRVAYEQLERQSDEMFAELTRNTSRRNGLRVRFTRCEQPYDSDEELVCAVRTLSTGSEQSTTSSGTPRPGSVSTETGSSGPGSFKTGTIEGSLGGLSQPSCTRSTVCAGPRGTCPITRRF